MTTHQMEQLLNVLMYYARSDIRARAMAEVPEAYAAYCATRSTASSAALAEHARIKAEWN